MLTVEIAWWAVATVASTPFAWMGVKQAKLSVQKWQARRVLLKAPYKKPPVEIVTLPEPELPYDPSAFWNWPDWSGGTNLTDGATPFWMLPPKAPVPAAIKPAVQQPDYRVYSTRTEALQAAKQATRGLQSDVLTAVRAWLVETDRCYGEHLNGAYIQRSMKGTWLIHYARVNALELATVCDAVHQTVVTTQPAIYEMSNDTLESLLGVYG